MNSQTRQATDPFSSAGVVGAGSWGTALTCLLSEAGVPVTLWTKEQEQVDEINRKRTNAGFLPGIRIADTVRATTRMEDVAEHPLVVVVVPSRYVRSVAKQLAATGLGRETLLLSCSKGIESGTGLRMSAILKDECPENPVAALSGPNHAEEVANRLATAAVVGAEQHEQALALQRTLRVPWFRLYTSTDVAGIELGGAIKNVFALAGGVADGLGLGDNAKAALVTRGLAEMVRLGVALGGRSETFFGLSGVGDLVVTCYSEHSRNHRAGRMLGQGLSLDEVMRKMAPMVAEGIPNSESIFDVAHRSGVSTPLIDEIHAVIHKGKDPGEALRDLLARRPRPESDEQPAAI